MWDYISDFDIFCWRSKNMLYFFVNRPWKRLSKNLLSIKRGFSKAYKYFVDIRKNKSNFLNLRKTKSPPLNLKFFLKSTRPSLPLREGPPLSLSPFLMEKVGCTRQYESELSLRSFAQPFPSGYRGCTNRPFNSLYDPFGSPCRGQKRRSEPFFLWLADHQRSTPAAELQFFVRDEPPCWKAARD